MNKKSIVRAVSAVALSVSAVLFADVAVAATLGTTVGAFNADMSKFADTILSAMFLAGLGTGGMAAFKFKEHNENPQQVKLSRPLTYLLASGMLIGLPTTVNMMSDTIAGGTANQAGVGAGAYTKMITTP